MRYHCIRSHRQSGLECLDGSIGPIEASQNQTELKVSGWKEMVQTDGTQRQFSGVSSAVLSKQCYRKTVTGPGVIAIDQQGFVKRPLRIGPPPLAQIDIPKLI